MTKEGRREGRKGTSSVLPPLLAPFKARSSDLLVLLFARVRWKRTAPDLSPSVVHSISSPSGRQARSRMVVVLDRSGNGRMEHQSRMGGEQTTANHRCGPVSASSLWFGLGKRGRRLDATSSKEEKAEAGADASFSLPCPLPPLLCPSCSCDSYLILSTIQWIYSTYVEKDSIFVGRRKALVDGRVSPLFLLARSSPSP